MAIALLGGEGCEPGRGGGPARGPFVSGPLPWHGQGVWLAGDIHTHYVLRRKRGTRVVGWAEAAGLDFLVSTEHAEESFRDGDADKLAALRAEHPGILLLYGIEWNVPGTDHASVIVEPSAGEQPLLRDFAERFDRKVATRLSAMEPVEETADSGREPADDEEDERDHAESASTWGSLADAEQGLRWLAAQESAGRPRSVVYMNHPGRRSAVDLDGWRALFAAGLRGLSAAPGHQRDLTSFGDYTIDRHEPMVENVGGDYDALLAEGVSVGIAAGSDYHTSRTSFPPGAFSRTLVHARGRTAAGVLEGLAAGATATVLGGIVTAVETRTSAPGMDDAAGVGETLTVPVGSTVFYSVLLEVPATDFQRRPNRVDRVEIVADLSGAPAVVAASQQIGLGPVRLDFQIPPEATARPRAFYLRARGRRLVGGPGNAPADADYLFHIGATWVRVE